MTREEAIRILDPEFVANEFAKYDEEHGIRDREHLKAIYDACVLAVSALREQEERSKPKGSKPSDVIREKLVELIESARYWGSNTSEEIADHLIRNGVTVHEWVSVDERLPGEKVNCIVHYKHAYCDNDDYWEIGICFYDGEKFRIGCAYKVTHWMPLPEPPKGE